MNATALAPEIVAAACVFPAGPNIALADVALQAQLALIRQHPFYVDRCGRRARVSGFPDPTAHFDLARWWALAQAALMDLDGHLDGALSAPANPSHTQLGLWLVLPDPRRPGQPADLTEALTAHLQAWQPTCRIACVYGGHAAGATAIEAALRWLAPRPQALAVILAVDCYLASDALYWLEAEGLLHGSHRPYEGQPRANPYGRVPGEGAAALALRGARMQNRDRPAAWAHLLACATAQEPVLRSDIRPCIGQGLSEASRRALRQARPHLSAPAQGAVPAGTRPAIGARRALASSRSKSDDPSPIPMIGRLTVDLNGEPYRADAFGFTFQRIQPWLEDDLERVTPALASGDLGAASLIAHVALAAYALHRQAGDEPTQCRPHLVLASSDDALRAALVLGAASAVVPESVAPSSRPAARSLELS